MPFCGCLHTHSPLCQSLCLTSPTLPLTFPAGEPLLAVIPCRSHLLLVSSCGSLLGFLYLLFINLFLLLSFQNEEETEKKLLGGDSAPASPAKEKIPVIL